MSPRAWKFVLLIGVPFSLAVYYGIYRVLSAVWPFDISA